MENIFWLHPDNPLTVKTIQNILAQQVSINYSAESASSFNLNKGNLEAESLQSTDLTNFAIGLGSEVPVEITRVLLLLLADFFTKNPLAASPEIISRILEFYQFEIFPQVFSQGLPASPTAHLLMPVFGKGKVYFQNYLLNAADVHDIFSWPLLSWPEKLPNALLTTSFLGLGSLVYNFIQFKKISTFSQIILSESDYLAPSNNLFLDQMEQLQIQLNEALAFPTTQEKHVNGLTYQLEKLLAKFGEHMRESLSEIVDKSATFYFFRESLPLKAEYLLSLLQNLSEENLILYEGGLDINSGPSTNFTHHLWLQPYQILKNLEQIMALATILQLAPSVNQQINLNLTGNRKAAYRNQVIDVLKEAVFAELIRKTISFMYATTPTN
ncbi:aromatic amino acid lyase [Adhaeribacter radiodurans]|uniref:Aromatic amino acid lyase n=1 Tax=Adhaeribacter radiodurans TaxID=2745197 RepID=A0A7L7L819_9BACT|nr:aromatic amino acid lyase [Adhaeribacter radiodurans]QMU28947.1 aromatic amino acid lyase [Adhaeribacter radiodurans]